MAESDDLLRSGDSNEQLGDADQSFASAEESRAWGRRRAARFWLVSIAAMTTWAVVLVKVATADFSRIAISAETLTSLVLSVFAIGLSAAFYFRAEKVSSDHYGRTYEFTERVAELLSRLEVGLVSQLGQLTRAQTSLEATAWHQLVESKQTATDLSTAAGDVTSPTPLARGPLHDADLNDFLGRLAAYEAEHQQSTAGERGHATTDNPPLAKITSASKELPRSFVAQIWETVIPALGGPTEVAIAAPAVIESRFGRAAGALDSVLLETARSHALVDSSLQLSNWGLLVLRRIAQDGPLVDQGV